MTTVADLAPEQIAAPPAQPTARPWYRPGGADLVFLVLALVLVQTARQGMIDDPGLGWHLRNVDAMYAAGGWLTTDPFTEPDADGPRPWRTNQWLGELPLWLGWKWAGLEGIAMVGTLVLAFTLRCLYRMLLADGLPWPAAVFWTALAAMGTSCSWIARPNLFTLLFVLLTARTCDQYHRGKLSARATLWLWPLFALWANVHGGFVAGFTLLGVALLAETGLALLASEPESRRAARRRAGHLVVLTAGACTATLLNPYGLSLYRWVFGLLGDPFFMDLHHEWRSPDFHGKGSIRYELLLLLLPLLLAVSRYRPNLVELGMALLWLHFALHGFRYVPLWVLVVTPLLARASVQIPWLVEQARRHGLASGGLFAPRPGPAPWLASALVAIALLGWARAAEGRFARHQPQIIPAAALDHFLQVHAEWRQVHGRRPVLFHGYDWGGYLTWHGWPEVRNAIDDRNETQGKERIQQYFRILEAGPGWEDGLARVDLVCVPPDVPLARRLGEHPAWRLVCQDDRTIVFKRILPARG